jgi:hypothetical protein
MRSEQNGRNIMYGYCDPFTYFSYIFPLKKGISIIPTGNAETEIALLLSIMKENLRQQSQMGRAG